MIRFFTMIAAGACLVAGPTARDVFLKDPRGQVETIAAGGHFVTWSVQTPADDLPDDGDDRGEVPPIKLPTSTKIVIADERGGTPLTVSLDRRWVSRMRMVRGAGGPAEPQLAVESCTSRAQSSCRAELLTITAAALLQVTARTGGPNASAAVAGLLDSGRRLKVASSKRRWCAARLSVSELGAPARALPPLPARDRTYTRCEGLSGRLIFGHFAFAWVRRSAPRDRFEADFVYGIDLAAGPSPQWRQIYRPYRSTEGSTGFAFGPAVTDRALYWEETDPEFETTYSLQQVALPSDVLEDPPADAPRTADPIAPDATNTCDIAATDAAIYELSNPRCTIWPGTGGGGEIRRIVNPVFRSSEG